jgi:hypothetical protein
MKIPLLYGFLMTLLSALTSLALFFTGFHESAEKVQSTQWIGMVVGFGGGIGLTALAIRARRAEYPSDKQWGYGAAVGTGVLTALVAVVLGTVFSYLYFTAINPGISDIFRQMQSAKMQAKGASEVQIDQALKFMTPAVMCIFQAVGGFFFGTVISLIVAIFFRQPLPRNEFADAELPPAV